MSNDSNNAQHTTSCDTQLPGSVFANVGAFLYLSGDQISRSYETATAYTADVMPNAKKDDQTENRNEYK
jgi:hypothetical protein